MYALTDAIARPLEMGAVRQNRFLRMMPPVKGRRGGTHTLTEWAYTIGLFQAVVSLIMGQRDQLDVLDVGCGTGRLGLAVAPLLGSLGRYVGVDVSRKDIDICRAHHTDPRFTFHHLLHSNRSYAPDQPAAFTPYPFEDASFDLATALSVWTHLNEADGLFYAKEVSRCLRPGGKAIITFFYLDADYERFRANVPAESAFSLRNPRNYLCTDPIDGSPDWLRPSNSYRPESIVGVTPAGMAKLEQHAGLRLEHVYRGNWKELPGLFFQDTLVFSKA